MHTHRTQQRILSLPLHKLYRHPDNANRMSKAKFNRLMGHLSTTGQYEPLVVRRHPAKENAWQVLNGHHRLRALRQLKHTRADCVVFAADDAQARLYLLNLNRLVGRDNVYKKAKLIEQLCRAYTPAGSGETSGRFQDGHRKTQRTLAKPDAAEDTGKTVSAADDLLYDRGPARADHRRIRQSQR